MKNKLSMIATTCLFGVGICVAAFGKFNTSHTPAPPIPPIPPTPPTPPTPPIITGYNWNGTNWQGYDGSGTLSLVAIATPSDDHPGAAMIVDHDEYTATNLVIPDRVVKDNKFYEIKRIGQNAFNGCSEINGAIKFPSTLVMVEDEAFSGCPNIVDIANAYGQIGTSNLYVEKIGGVKVLIDTPTFDEISRVQGSCAFGANLNLSDVPNLTGISTFAFNRCDNMTGTLTLPSTLINVGDAAFYGCNNISIIIGKCTAEPTWLGRDIFSNWRFTGDVANTNSSYSSAAFSTYLKSKQLPPNWGTVYKWDGSDWVGRTRGNIVMSPNSEPTGDALGTATITNTVSTFTANDLVIPNLVINNESIYKITSIAKAPFWGMSSVSGSITLPSTLTSMANASADSGGSFYDCSGVTSIANAPGPLGAGLYVVQLGGVKVVINTPTFDETSVIQGSCAFGTNLDLSTIPNLTSINNLALTGAGFEGTLTLPNTLVDVGDYAFSMCKRFNHIVGNYNADPSWNGTSIFRYGGSSGTVTNNDGNYSSANFLGYLQSKLLNGAWTAV